MVRAAGFYSKRLRQGRAAHSIIKPAARSETHHFNSPPAGAQSSAKWNILPTTATLAGAKGYSATTLARHELNFPEGERIPSLSLPVDQVARVEIQANTPPVIGLLHLATWTPTDRDRARPTTAVGSGQRPDDFIQKISQHRLESSNDRPSRKFRVSMWHQLSSSFFARVRRMSSRAKGHSLNYSNLIKTSPSNKSRDRPSPCAIIAGASAAGTTIHDGLVIVDIALGAIVVTLRGT